MNKLKQELRKQKLEDDAEKIGCKVTNYRLFRQYQIRDFTSTILWYLIFLEMGIILGVLM